MTPCLKFSRDSELSLGTEFSAARTHITQTPWNLCLMPFKEAETRNTPVLFLQFLVAYASTFFDLKKSGNDA